ncbi:hypothetical protein ATCC90586_006360 [Pythium insidiosum]|nr:hypothetical protein ATCC90586_006360 [Pythium insidiosum]
MKHGDTTAIAELIGQHAMAAQMMRKEYKIDTAAVSENNLVITMDYAQNIALPHVTETPSQWYFLSLISVSVFGIHNANLARQTNYIYTERKGGKGSNEVVSMLQKYIGCEPTHKVLTVYADNCGGQNKNNFVVKYLLLLAHTSLFEERASISTDTVSLEEVESPFFAYKDIFNELYKNLPAIQKYQLFRMTASNPGVVECRELPSSPAFSVDLRREYDGIVAAARHGKHIFCEKPVDLSLDIVNHAIAEVERAGVKMMVGFNRRFDANFQRIRQAIVSGEIGTVTMVRITSRDPSPPPIEYVQASGGMFKDMTIHDFDMARFLVGDDVDEVYAMTQSRHAEIAAVGDIDTAVCLLKFKSGVIAYIENSRDAAYGYDQRVEVLGSLGSVSCDNVFSNNVVVSTRDSVRRDLPLHFFLERYMDAYVSEMESFLRVVSGSSDEEMPVGGVDGREALLLAVAAEKSRLENRPIKVDACRST